MAKVKMPGVGRGNNPGSRKTQFKPLSTIHKEGPQTPQQVAQIQQSAKRAVSAARARHAAHITKVKSETMTRVNVNRVPAEAERILKKSLGTMATRMGITDFEARLKDVDMDFLQDTLREIEESWETVFSDSPDEWPDPIVAEDTLTWEEGPGEEFIRVLIEKGI